MKYSLIKNLRNFDNFSRDEIFDHRRTKFLQIGRDQGFTKSADLNDGSLSYKEPNFAKFKSHIENNKLLYSGLVLLAIAGLISLFS